MPTMYPFSPSASLSSLNLLPRGMRPMKTVKWGFDEEPGGLFLFLLTSLRCRRSLYNFQTIIYQWRQINEIIVSSNCGSPTVQSAINSPNVNPSLLILDDLLAHLGPFFSQMMLK